MIYEDYFDRMYELFESVYDEYENEVMLEEASITKDGISYDGSTEKQNVLVKWIKVALKAIWKKIADLFAKLADKLRETFKADKVTLSEPMEVCKGIINCNITPFKKVQTNIKLAIRGAKYDIDHNELVAIGELNEFTKEDIKKLKEPQMLGKGSVVNVTKISNFYKELSNIARKCIQATEFYDPKYEVKKSNDEFYVKSQTSKYIREHKEDDQDKNSVSEKIKKSLSEGKGSKLILSNAAFTVSDFARECEKFITDLSVKATKVNNESIDFDDVFEI